MILPDIMISNQDQAVPVVSGTADGDGQFVPSILHIV
jgi:hypothetical protein